MASHGLHVGSIASLFPFTLVAVEARHHEVFSRSVPENRSLHDLLSHVAGHGHQTNGSEFLSTALEHSVTDFPLSFILPLALFLHVDKDSCHK